MEAVSKPEAKVELPDNLPADVRRQLLALGEESPPQPVPFAIDELFIRHWCEALEDGNPLYIDDDFARARGLRGLMVPPAAFLAATIHPFRWPWPPKGGYPEIIQASIKRVLGMPVGIVSHSAMEFFQSVQIGERLATTSRLLSVSPLKKTRLGTGHFVSYACTYWNERRDKLAEQISSSFIYGRGMGRDEGIAIKGGFSNAIEEAIEGEKTPYQPPAPIELHWDDVNEGDKLPPIHLPINMTRCVYMASATRDFSPQHTNPEYAKTRSKTRDVFVNMQFNMGMVSRLATDWAGPSAIVRRLEIKMNENICAGDEMIVTGIVTKKYVQNGEHRVDIDVMISNEERPATVAAATLALPTRPAGAGG